MTIDSLALNRVSTVFAYGLWGQLRAEPLALTHRVARLAVVTNATAAASAPDCALRPDSSPPRRFATLNHACLRCASDRRNKPPPIVQVDFIKVDVDGAEPLVLQGNATQRPDWC